MISTLVGIRQPKIIPSDCDLRLIKQIGPAGKKAQRQNIWEEYYFPSVSTNSVTITLTKILNGGLNGLIEIQLWTDKSTESGPLKQLEENRLYASEWVGSSSEAVVDDWQHGEDELLQTIKGSVGLF